MFNPAEIPPVDSDETLARFVLHASHIRHDQTVKPDAFMPHPRIELSVTRHRASTVDELWCEGLRVSSIRQLKLHGRADVAVKSIESEQLEVVAKPIPENPNHADVVRWPIEKPLQKMKALEIANRSKLVLAPANIFGDL
mgnify:CR=1 FL=1